MSRINRVPAGLQDLLGSQNFGDNPSELGGVVAPVLELERLLTAERRTELMGGSTPTMFVDGTILTTTVPLGQLWLVEALGVRVQFSGAAAPWQAQFYVNKTNALNSTAGPTTQHPIAYLGEVTPNANATVSSGLLALEKTFDKLMILYGGETLNWGIMNGDYSGTKGYTCATYARYIKLFV